MRKSQLNPQKALVELYRAAEKFTGGKPSVDGVRKAARGYGVVFTDSDASRWLAPFIAKYANGELSTNRTTSQKSSNDFKHDSRTTIEPLIEHKSNDSRTTIERVAALTRGKGIPVQSTTSEPNGSSVPPPPKSRAQSQRVALVVPVVDFGPDESAVASVLANDAAQRADGKIATSVLSGLRAKLERHRVKHGDDALRHGLQVATDRGKGADYACGVARQFVPGEEATKAAGVRQILVAPNPSDLLRRACDIPANQNWREELGWTPEEIARHDAALIDERQWLFKQGRIASPEMPASW